VRTITSNEARRIGDSLHIPWDAVALDEFRRGLEVEFEHGLRDPDTNVTDDDELVTGTIAWAHFKDFPDDDTRLDRLEAEADAYWASRG
jgi:hypothetical protein